MKNKEHYYKFSLNMNIANVIAIIEFIIISTIAYFFKWIDFSNISYFLVFFLILIYTAIHEGLHGIAFALNTKKWECIKYGILLEKGVFYAACQTPIEKKGIIFSLLFPTIILTFIPLPFAIYFHIDLLTICALYNFIGAIGDLMMTYFIIKLPKDIKYIDYDITVGATFISEDDLTPYSRRYMSLIEEGVHKDSNIDKSVKRFYCSKKSFIILVVLIIIVGLSALLNYL